MHKKEILDYQREYRGLIGVRSKLPLKDENILTLVYTPGVAEPCLEIARENNLSFDYTSRGNTVAIVTDGSAVLELGEAGTFAALPVMEGKSVIFKTFAGVDAFPICVNSKDPYKIIEIVSSLSPTFGAICLEDISSPRCFTIEDHLNRAMGIPVYHNDQHSAAIEILAGLINASKITGKPLKGMKITISGAGAAAIATAKMLLKWGVTDILLCDKAGAIHQYRLNMMNWAKHEIARMTNLGCLSGSLSEVIKGRDVFIGLSSGGVLTGDMVASMAKDPVIFALAVPVPEIMPEEARLAGAKIVATGRTDFPNELNVALVFPGLFRGILDVSAVNVNYNMKVAAAVSLAGLVSGSELTADYIIPKVVDFRIAPAVASAVAKAAIESGEARRNITPEEVYERTEKYINEGHFPYKKRKRWDKGTLKEKSIELHYKYNGMIELIPKIPIKDPAIFSNLYLPPATVKATKEIIKDSNNIYKYTSKSNMVAVITDGSAVLGLGNIGPWAAMPVMEGKAVLFNTMSGVEAFPIALGTQNTEEIINIVKNISTSFGGINLEDISAPRCFIIEERLKKEIDIPVFHDDQHGTAVVVLAGLINASKLTGKPIETLKVTINGSGAAGIAVCRLLISYGIKNIILCDSIGVIYEGREKGMNPFKDEIAKQINPEGVKGDIRNALKGRDVFIGVSKGGIIDKTMIASMNKDAIVFALANPVPEIMPEEAKLGGAKIVATGRSDLPNQINNSLAFPGIFRGALDVRAKNINDRMKIAAAKAISEIISDNDLREDHIIPKGLDFRTPPAVAKAVAAEAIASGEARIAVDPEKVEEHTRSFIYEGDLGLI